MSQTKTRRPTKRQLGQYMTPSAQAKSLIERLHVSKETRVLEPSFGDGSFIMPLIERFLPLYEGPISERLDNILNNNVYGVEIDLVLYKACLDKILARWKHLPASHNLVCTDFFRHDFYPTQNGNCFPQRVRFGNTLTFDLIVGNPPFGGTIDLKLQDKLDKKYGFRNGAKIKKETYAFFIVKCLDQLKKGGSLLFICSDTFMTIRTMRGLRKLLMEECTVTIEELGTFSEETSYPMVLLELAHIGRSDAITINDRQVTRNAMELTGNFSWAITDATARFFDGSKLGDYVVCSSGMTIGKNDLFVREIFNSEILEPCDFEFYDDPITVEKELQRARLHTLSTGVLEKIRQQEQSGVTRRNVRIVKKPIPERIHLPHPDYRFYNKAAPGIIYTRPTHAVYWKNDGDAVLTFKKNGNWYLHGVGGKPYFGRSGLTWQLVASRLNVRYLPEGYILDSGAPCAFLRPGVNEAELFFILGWTCTDLATYLLKTVINHTMNIQGKDFERLPYPYWVNEPNKERIIRIVRALVQRALAGAEIKRTNAEVQMLNDLYSYNEVADGIGDARKDQIVIAPKQLSFLNN